MNRVTQSIVAGVAALVIGGSGVAYATATNAPPSIDSTLAKLDQAQSLLDEVRADLVELKEAQQPPTTPVPTAPTTTPAPTGAPVVASTVEAESDSRWVYSGAWSKTSVDAYTREPGATATLSFTGTQLDLYGIRDTHHGIVTVSVDGRAVDVDEYRPSRTASSAIFSTTLPAGQHTVKVTMTNRANPARVTNKGLPVFSLDRAVINGTQVPTTTPPAPTTPVPTTSAPTTGNPPPAAPVGLITREGMKLKLNGTDYKFAGLNMDAAFGCWSGEYDASTDAQLDTYFRELNPRSMTRVWAYAGARWEPKLRQIVAAAERHNQYLMVTLSDANDGGTQCFSNKGSGYPADGGAVLSHVRNIVPKFKDTSTIAVWEIINEGTRDPSAKSWYQTIAKEIKRLDPNTLVASGAGTCYNTNWQQCVAVDDFPENDLIDFHEYDWNNGGVSHWADEAQNIARSLGKPWFVGESGFIDSRSGSAGSDAGNAPRMKREFDSYLATDAVGYLYWTFKVTHNRDGVVNPGDPMWRAVSAYRHTWNSQ